MTRDSASPVAMETRVTGRRIAAFLVDNVVITALISLGAAPYLLLLLSLDPAFYERAPGVVLVAMVTALYSLVVMLGITLGYYALLEGYRGQTVGKMLFGLKVVREDGGTIPGPKAAMLRALMLLVADAQLFCIVGLITILVTEKRQRLGDMAAGTLVVRRERRVRR